MVHLECLSLYSPLLWRPKTADVMDFANAQIRIGSVLSRLAFKLWRRFAWVRRSRETTSLIPLTTLRRCAARVRHPPIQ